LSRFVSRAAKVIWHAVIGGDIARRCLRPLWPLAALAFLLTRVISAGAQTEHHRATHLGNPATRFASPLFSTEDLRARFNDQKLRPDFAAVLHQWGWPGNPDDLMAAGMTNSVVEWGIQVGDTVPFMSSRENGTPVCLRNVTWAGAEPIHAYTFTFHSNGRVYRCIVPKPCSNFFVVDLGPEPKSGLALECIAPEKVILGRPFKVCLNVHNAGNIPEPLANVMLPIPEGASVTALTDSGVFATNLVSWDVTNLPVNATKQICAILQSSTTGTLTFNPIASSATATPVQSICTAEVAGIPAILLEKADDPDPVAVGDTTTYTVKVTNQGTADDTDVQVIVTIASQLIPVSSSEGTFSGQTVTLPVVPRLASKASVTYTITARGVTAGDGHTLFTLSSGMLSSAIKAEESTTVY
jgi:uncharacterized repeat protein (TIGR01451 family)